MTFLTPSLPGHILLRTTKIEATIPFGWAGRWYQGRIWAVHPGVDKTATDNRGQTALHYAARSGQRRCGILLLAANPVVGCMIRGTRNPPVDINALRDDGATPLMLAASQGHLKMVRMLLHRGALMEVQEVGTGATALLQAVENGHLACVDALLDPKHCSYRSERMLEKEKTLGATVKALQGQYEGGGLVGFKTVAAQEPRRNAKGGISKRNVLVVEEPVDAGVTENGEQANIRHRDRRGHDAVLYAAYHQHIDILELLLDKMPELVETACLRGITPLMVGARNGHNEVRK